MDWSPRETFLFPHGIDDFEYDVETDLPITVMQKFDPKPVDKDQFEIEKLNSLDPETEFWPKFKASISICA